MQSFFYASTFPTGFETTVLAALKITDPRAVVEIMQDGLVIYTSSIGPAEIRRLPFFNNTFLVLHRGTYDLTLGIKKIVDDLFRKSQLQPLIGIITALQIHSFRFLISKENQIQPMPPYQRQTFEKIVVSVLKLQVDRTSPETEFWFFVRRDGMSFCGLRLTRRAKPKKGELGGEVSFLLNFLSDPQDHDVLLDPFAGSGSIPSARAQYFPYQEIIVNDHNQEIVQVTRQLLHANPHVLFLEEDALHLTSIKSHSVDVIVTDPPWGLFEKFQTDSHEFHTKMLEEFQRVLKTGERVVILTACARELRELILESDWQTIENFKVLISGKKAEVFSLKKT